ncbi:MAG: hypothetical protein LRY43_02335 [Gammaproteobacteria bacterium]|nr:hypothetical protein [Gammaproteobacteria bacterium]
MLDLLTLYDYIIVAFILFFGCIGLLRGFWVQLFSAFVWSVGLVFFLSFFLLSIIYNVYGHLGWELYPKGFAKSLIGKWINTSVCHNQHHRFAQGNYGLYFFILG